MVHSDENVKQLMRIACWITKATNTHSEYIILNGFSTAVIVARKSLDDTLYVLWLFRVIEEVRNFFNFPQLLPARYNSDSVVKHIGRDVCTTVGIYTTSINLFVRIVRFVERKMKEQIFVSKTLLIFWSMKIV